MTVTTEWRGDVAVVRLGDDANAFDATLVTALLAALDEVEATDRARAVVTTGAGKFYSNGFDLGFLGGLEPDELEAFLARSRAVLARVLVLGLPTVAALNGHTFGVGAMLACAHDLRVMRADRGWFCLPEVDLGLRLDPFQLAVVAGRLPRPTLEEAILTGRRYPGDAALAAGIVDATAAEADLLDAAVALAEARAGKDRTHVVALKGDLHAPALAALAALDG